MNKLGTKLGAIAMSAVMALSFAPSAAITSLAASGDDLLDATFGVEPVYRLYNPNSGEHLFTTDVLERDSLVKENWDNEGAKWNAPSVSAEGIYRLYNPSTGEHLYTSDGLEIAHLVNDEKWEEDFGGYPAFYAADDDLDPDAITINRFFNPAGTGVSAHIFSADPAEIKALTDKGYEKENGFGGYPLDYEPEEPVEELTVSIDNPTPKVEDTLTATVVDRNGKDVSDNVTFQWYADDKAIEGETDETLDVTVGMIGSTIKVVVTAENGNTFSSDPTAPVYAYSFEIEEASATKVNEITVTFANPVEAENVTFTVTKGTESVPIEKVTADNWSLTEDEVTLKTSANMVKGTYTVTATDSVTKDTDSADFEVEAQKVARIVIKAGENNVALTGDDEKEAYAYYDVYDQYDQSIRTSASIQWTGSCIVKADKTNGKLTFTKDEGKTKTWVYNEQIYITGVYTKTGVVNNSTLTVGTKQSLDSIEMVGFLKKGKTDIIQDLPKDFKEKEYYLLFHALDQNGNAIEAEDVSKEDVTFVSDSPLVVKELTFDETTEGKGFTVKGTEYNGIFVTPGIKVSEGGEVNVTAIANKTGSKTNLNFMVGEDVVVGSFTITTPSAIVADGDTVELDFTALDETGENKITNFRQLAKQELFNTLSFTASEGYLKLAEQDDGSAKLTWTDEAKYQNNAENPTAPWKESVTTDDIDRPISLTVVVVGGESDNEMMYVSDKRRPNAIADVNLDDVMVEGNAFSFTLGSFQYYDQYGKIIPGTDDKKVYGDGSGFFAAAAANLLQNLDFKGYNFGVRIENAGTGKIVWNNPAANAAAAATEIISGEMLNVARNPKKAVVTANAATTTAYYMTTTDIQSVASGEGFKFDIAKIDGAKVGAVLTYTNPADWESVSPTKYEPVTVVDITQVSNFKIKDLNTMYIGELAGVTGKGIIAKEEVDHLKATDTYYVTDANEMPEDHRQEVKVTGTYSDSSVSIPGDYFTIESGKLDDTNDDDTFDTTKAGKIALSDLYDKTTANGTAKLATDEVKATIIKLYDDNATTVAYWALDPTTGEFYTTTEKEKVDATKTINDNKVDVALMRQINAANAKLPADAQLEDEDDLDELLAVNTTAAGTVEAAKANLKTKNEELETAEANLKAAKSQLRTANAKLAEAEAADTKAADDETAAGNVEVSVTGQTGKQKISAVTEVTAVTNNITATTTPEQMAALEVTNKIEDETDIEAVKAYYVAVKNHKDTTKAKTDATQTVTDLTNTIGTPADTTAQPATAATGLYLAVDNAEAAVEAAEYALLLAQQKEAQTAATKALADFNQEVEEKIADNDNGTPVNVVFTTTKSAITFSDQAPYAAKIDGLAESYTFVPTDTKIGTGADAATVNFNLLNDKLSVKDQYGVKITDAVLEYTISNPVESSEGYAENNFKISDNGTLNVTINGAERGDTFDLTVSVKGETLKATTKVTVGADTRASIVNAINYYTNGDSTKGIAALKDTLEAQRKAGLQ